MAFCERGDGAIFYTVQGKGEPLLLLRGLGRSSRYWLGFETEIAKSFQVITVDNRGIGRSTLPMKFGDGIEDLALDCLAVMDELSIRKSHVFGLSLGGMIALKLAADHQERVNCVVVAASSTGDYLGLRLHPSAVRNLALGAVRKDFHKALVQQLIAADILKARPDYYESEWEAIRAIEGLPIKTIVMQLLAARRFRICARVDTAITPTLILSGSEDNFVPAQNSRRLHQLIRGSALHVVDGAGHEIALGREKEIAALVGAFIDRQEASHA